MSTSDSAGRSTAHAHTVARGYPRYSATPIVALVPSGSEEPVDSPTDASAQPSPYAPLPDPELLLINLTRGVMEALAGVREPEQLARWLSDAAFASLLKRVVLANRARVVTKRKAIIPRTVIQRVIVTRPNVGVIEAVLVVQSPVRTRAVAVRLEGLGDRWRASSLHVL